MKHLQFETTVDAPAARAWKSMLDRETYVEWTKEAWPGSSFEGRWGKGEKIRFVGTEGGGTLARIDEYEENKRLLATHIAVLNADGSEDTESSAAKEWIGTLEAYTFTEKDGKTTITVDIHTNPSWASMFEDDWPKALQSLKRVIEGSTVNS